MYKKIRERNRRAAGTINLLILPTTEEIALRLSAGRELAPAINQAARVNEVNRSEVGIAVVSDAADNRAENSLCSNSTTLDAIQVADNNIPVPQIIIYVSSIEQVDIQILLF